MTTNTLDERRATERRKYHAAYQRDHYRMGPGRLRGVLATLLAGDGRASLLDVGTGRGEMLDAAGEAGWELTHGTEVVPYLVAARQDVVYADAWDLPFDDASWETVTMLDVLEHLLPEDAERTCRELCRVAERRVVLTVHNCHAYWADVGELHIHRRPYEEWDELLIQWLSDWGEVAWLRDADSGGSETWEINCWPSATGSG